MRALLRASIRPPFPLLPALAVCMTACSGQAAHGSASHRDAGARDAALAEGEGGPRDPADADKPRVDAMCAEQRASGEFVVCVDGGPPDAGARDASESDGSVAEGCTAFDATIAVESREPFDTLVWLFDASGGAAAGFPGASSRQDAVREALFGPEGVLTRIQGDVRLGGTSTQASTSVTCTQALAARQYLFTDFDNAAAVEEVMLTFPPAGLATPDEGIAYPLRWYQQDPNPPQDEAIYVGRSANVLVLHDTPGKCDWLAPTPDYGLALQPASDALSEGIATFVVDVGVGSAEARDYLDEIAAAGGTGAALHPADMGELRDAFETVVAGGCSFALPALDGRSAEQLEVHLDTYTLEPREFRLAGGGLTLLGVPCQRVRAAEAEKLRVHGRFCSVD